MANTTKSDLVSNIAQKAGMKKVDAEKALEAIIAGIQGALKSGKKVTLVGFGTFQVSKRAARKGMNPQTKKPIQIPASKTVRFRVGSLLKSAVN